ncbi:hypothetical protein LV779_19025 [Streptomyces thinghirensis]|nr:hypothetical protein [Streptomyces thinghirensis]
MLDARDGVTGVVTGTLRRDEGSAKRVLKSLAELHVRGGRRRPGSPVRGDRCPADRPADVRLPARALLARRGAGHR